MDCFNVTKTREKKNNDDLIRNLRISSMARRGTVRTKPKLSPVKLCPCSGWARFCEASHSHSPTQPVAILHALQMERATMLRDLALVEG